MSRSNRNLLVLGELALIGSLMAIAIWLAGIGLRSLLLNAVILALLGPVLLRTLSGTLDLFEPLVLGVIAMAIMFIGRPLADLATERTMHLGYPIMPTFNLALMVVLVGILAFQLGYHSNFSSRWARYLPHASAFQPRRAASAAWMFFLLGGALFSIFLAKGGGLSLLLFLLKGRSGQDNAIYLGSTGYFYNGISMWAASALIFFALAITVKRRRYFIAFMAMALPLLIFYGASGTRIQLLPLVLSVPIFWYLWKQRRPAGRTLIIAAILGISIIGWQREVRTVATSANRDKAEVLFTALAAPGQQFKEILTGADNEMFDSITNELIVVPSKLAYRPAGTLTDLFITAVPRPLWPNKPLVMNSAVVNALWPAHYAASRASAAFSIVGPFYADSGFIGVALGMFFTGVVLAMSWRWFLRYQGHINALLIYSMGLPFVVILMRGTLPDTLSRMLFMVVPLVLAMWIARFRWGKSPAFSRRRSTIESSSHK